MNDSKNDGNESREASIENIMQMFSVGMALEKELGVPGIVDNLGAMLGDIKITTDSMDKIPQSQTINLNLKPSEGGRAEKSKKNQKKRKRKKNSRRSGR